MPSPRQNWVVESKVLLIEVVQKNSKVIKLMPKFKQDPAKSKIMLLQFLFAVES